MDKPLSKGKRISIFISIIVGVLILIGLTTTSIFAEDITAEIHVDTPLTEENLDAGQIKITLKGTEFKDDVFNRDNFLLTNAPTGLTVGDVVYSSGEYIVNLDFDGTDFDSDINDLGLTIKGEELTSDSDLTTINTLYITATNESIIIPTGDYTISEDNEKYKLSSGYTGTITIADNVNTVTIIGDDASIQYTNTDIIIASRTSPIELTIKDLNIQSPDGSNGIDFGNAGNYDNKLYISGENHIEGLNSLSITNQGAGIRVPTGVQLTIDKAPDITEDSAAVLNAAGGHGGAGIGGGSENSGGTINISGGTVTATGGGGGAGIGGGRGNSGGTININGGIVEATGGSRGAGIGGGYDGSGGEINIEGGSVTATGGYEGAGIGGGTFGSGGTINIGGGIVEATGGSNGAGIGGGYDGSGGTININGGIVEATGGSNGAGIGGGCSRSGGIINIGGGSVEATGGFNGGGIGGGYYGSGGEVTINGGEVVATSSNAEHIGKGISGGGPGTLKDGEGNDLLYLRFNTIPDAVIKIEGIDGEYRTNEEDLAGAFVPRGSSVTYIVSKAGYAAVKNTHDISSGAYNYDINATMNEDNTPPTIDSVIPLVINKDISSIEIACDDYGIYGTIYLVPKTEISYTDKASLDGVVDKVMTSLESPSTTGIIDTTGISTEGIYQVYLVDSAENVSSPSEDILIDKTPPVINSPVAHIITDTSISFTWASEGKTDYIYKDESKIAEQSSAIGTYQLTGLDANTQYSFKVKSIDMAGNEGVAEEALVYTKALDPQDISLSSKTYNSLTFEIVHGDNQGVAPEYRLELKLKDAGADGENKGVSQWSSDTTRIISGLSQTTEYELWVHTRNGNELENTKYKEDIHIETLPLAINSPVADIITDTSISFTWVSGGETDYIYKDESKIAEQSSTIGTYELTGLSPNTEYSFKVKSIDMAGNERVTEEVGVYTKALDPKDISLSSKTYNSLIFEITHGDNQGVAPEYRLELKLKDAGADGENKGVSEWSSYTIKTFDGLSQSTEYELWIQTRNADGLENTKYKVNHIFTTSNKTDSSDDNSSSGGGGNNDNATSNTESSPSQENDQIIRDAIESGEKGVISLKDTNDGKAQITPEVIREIGKSNQSFTVENEGVSLEFPPMSLITVELNQGAWNKLEIGAREVTEGEKEDILRNTNMGESTGLFDIGGRIFDLTAQLVDEEGNTTRISSFNEPVAVTIDLSDMDLTNEDIANLTGIRYERDKEGNIIPVKLGGTYDPETKTFIFYTDKFSLYGVARAKSLTKIKLTIDNLHSEVNGKEITGDIAPTIVSSRTMVPLRFIAENMGANVNWIGEERKVIINLDNKTLELVIDKPIEGFDTPATIVNGRTMVPIRYIAEKIDSNVMWFPRNRVIYIVK